MRGCGQAPRRDGVADPRIHRRPDALVKRGLAAFERDELVDHRLLGKVAGDLLLGAPHQEGLDPGGEQALSRAVAPFLDRRSIAGREGFAVSEQAGDQPVIERPQLPEIVLERRPGQRQALPGANLPDTFGDGGSRVLDRLRLVQDGGVVVVAEQRFMVPVQERIGREDEMVVGDFREAQPTVGPVKHQELQVRDEACGLPFPVADQTCRHHHEARAVGLLLKVAMCKKGERLHGLAEPHVVGKHAAETAVGERPEPPVAGALIGTQLSVQRGWRLTVIRALPGERFTGPPGKVSSRPSWLTADERPVEALAATTAARLAAFHRAHPPKAEEAARIATTFAGDAADARATGPRLMWNARQRARWNSGAEPWLRPTLANITETLSAGDARTVTAAAPATDGTTAEAIAGLPAGFAKRLVLDMVLTAGKDGRLLIGSLPDDGEMYFLVLCRLDGAACGLRRIMMVSLLDSAEAFGKATGQ